MQIYKAKDVDEAIELAVKLKAKGKYDWFRGQTNLKPPHSRLYRIWSEDKNAAERAHKRLARFYMWVASTPGMDVFRRRYDDIIAIAQHYGIPTDFLDFTTEPSIAGFFAVHSKRRFDGKDACIYCLNTKKLLEFQNFMGKVFPKRPPLVECVKVDVPGLWRLHAQHGIFLKCNCNWEAHYPLDRIVFPRVNYPAYPTYDRVYPKEKSQLEIALDQYFHVERIYEGNRAMQMFIKELRAEGKGVIVKRLVAPRDNYYRKYFIRGGIPEHSSWEKGRLNRWSYIPDEPLISSFPRELRLEIDNQVKPDKLHGRITLGIKRAIELNPDLRQGSVNWQTTSKRPLNPKLTSALTTIWNGLRLLPFTPEEIAKALATAIVLHRLGFPNKRSDSSPFEELFGRSVLVGFSDVVGNYARSFASERGLKAAIRSDFKTYVRPVHRTKFGSTFFALAHCFSAPRLFNFRKLANLFACELVPVQVLESKYAPYFSPSRIIQFGIA
jgi:hypothetical protein